MIRWKSGRFSPLLWNKSHRSKKRSSSSTQRSPWVSMWQRVSGQRHRSKNCSSVGSGCCWRYQCVGRVSFWQCAGETEISKGLEDTRITCATYTGWQKTKLIKTHKNCSASQPVNHTTRNRVHLGLDIAVVSLKNTVFKLYSVKMILKLETMGFDHHYAFKSGCTRQGCKSVAHKSFLLQTIWYSNEV